MIDTPTPSPVTPGTYDELVTFAAADTDELPRASDPMWQAAERLLLREQRLLDGDHLRSWLDLCAEDAVYWIPVRPGDDPRERWSIAFDDRRRMEDRVAWMETGHVHGRTPPMRMQRSLSNVEVWEEAPRVLRCRSVASCRTRRPQRPLEWHATVHHRLRASEDGDGGMSLRIVWKVVWLIDAGDPQKNLTVVL